ncbi:MAG: hypothetical protein ACHQUC_01220 [Chlamydiales bacterium]
MMVTYLNSSQNEYLRTLVEESHCSDAPALWSWMETNQKNSDGRISYLDVSMYFDALLKQHEGSPALTTRKVSIAERKVSIADLSPSWLSSTRLYTYWS